MTYFPAESQESIVFLSVFLILALPFIKCVISQILSIFLSSSLFIWTKSDNKTYLAQLVKELNEITFVKYVSGMK